MARTKTYKTNSTPDLDDAVDVEATVKDAPKGWSKLKDWYTAHISPTVGNVLGYVKAHPGMSIGLGLGGAANLAGLLDNNKIGGQLIGAGLGGTAAHFIPKLLGATPLSVPAQVAIGLGGGTLGALFDTLRANKEQQGVY